MKANLNSIYFFFRQYLYRKVFDQLELGIIPDPLELEKNIKLHNQQSLNNANWKPFEISQFNNELLVVVFVDPGLRNLPLIFDDYSKDICLAFRNEETILKKLYPKLYKMIENNKLLFTKGPLPEYLVSAMQVPKLEFPSKLFANTNKSLEIRQKLAVNLLSWISNEVTPVVRYYDISGDIVNSYLKIEKIKLKQATVDQKIDLRIKFIEYLRKNYKILWK
jgi:hypothetical protein